MYINKLEAHIKKTLKDKNVEYFDELFSLSRGAFPDLVYSIVKDYKAASSLKKGYYGLKEVTNIIPESNPTNFDWRFDTPTIDRILKLIQNKNFKRIALFGCPSLFIPLSKLTKDITLYDVNETLDPHFNHDNRINIVDLNVHEFSNTSLYDCIIMDPPWYLDYYKIWLQKGNSLLKIQGEIFLTMFQDLLRPKAKSELKIIHNIARKSGSIELIENHVSYVTPLFEKELFNYKNTPCYGNWRIADLLILKKETDLTPLNPTIQKRDNWTRFELGTQVIAIKKIKTTKEITVLFPYENNDSLIKTVSDRDSIRKKLNFITSRNRGLIVNGTDKILSLLKSIAEGIPKTEAYTNEGISKKEQIEFQKILDTIFL